MGIWWYIRLHMGCIILSLSFDTDYKVIKGKKKWVHSHAIHLSIKIYTWVGCALYSWGCIFVLECVTLELSCIRFIFPTRIICMCISGLVVRLSDWLSLQRLVPWIGQCPLYADPLFGKVILNGLVCKFKIETISFIITYTDNIHMYIYIYIYIVCVLLT